MLKNLARKVIALSLAIVFASVFLSACGFSDAADTDPAKEYAVAFDTGVPGLEIAPIVGRSGTPLTAPEDPERDGYKFGGWFYNGQAYAFSTMPGRDITLSAKWNRLFTITFNSMGGSPVEPIVAAETERINAPPDPVRAEHQFNGWQEGGEKFFFTSMPSRDLELTAAWLGVVTITFITNVEGVTVAPIAAVPGTPVAVPAAPKNPGFYLVGWYHNDQKFSFTVMPSADVTLFAKWADAATITFVTGVDGVAVDPIVEIPGTRVSAPKAPQRPGYVLAGWFLNGTAFKFPATMPEEDIILTAQWALGTTISFDTGVAGLTVPDLVQIPGASISAPAAPLYAGHVLEGWYSGTTHYIFNVMPSSNLTLTAKWVTSSKLPAVTVTLQEADGTPIPTTDPRFAVKEYIYSAISVVGGVTGEKIQSVMSRFKPKGNGSFRPDPDVRRPYRIKFDKKQSLFGWPKSKHYTLVSASHNSNDPSRLVAHSAFDLTRDVLKGVEYSIRTQPVDLYINGVYRGIYVLTEKVRVEDGKLEIESEHAGAVSSSYKLDTGYLLFNGSGPHTGYGTDTIARFTLQGGREVFGGNGYYMESPRESDVADPEVPEATRNGYIAQRTYIQGETQKLINSMVAGDFGAFSQMSDVASWIDAYIVEELYGNSDANGGFYLYKKSSAQGGKWYAGAPWDYDATVRNANTGFKVNLPHMLCLYAMPEYFALLKARWKEVSPNIRTYLANKFNSYINDAGYQAAFARGAGGDASSSATASSNWQSEARGKLDWLIARVNWLDGEWK